MDNILPKTINEMFLKKIYMRRSVRSARVSNRLNKLKFGFYDYEGVGYVSRTLVRTDVVQFSFRQGANTFSFISFFIIVIAFF